MKNLKTGHFLEKRAEKEAQTAFSPQPEGADLGREARMGQTERAQKMKWLSVVLPFLRPALTPKEEPDSLFPKKVREAETSIVRICFEDGGRRCSEGSGFFISETLIATNFHVIVEMMSCRSMSIQTPSGARAAFQRIRHISAINDLAVLETGGLIQPENPPLAPYGLELAGRSDFFPGGEAYILGFPRGRFRKIKGARAKSDKFNYFFAADFSEDLRGGSGGPFLNRDGRVMGVFYIASGNICCGSRVKFLKDMLKTPPLPWTDRPDILIKKEAGRLKSLAQNGGGMEKAEARFRTALSLLDGKEQKDKRMEIIKWLQPAADYGHSRAQFCLGFLLFDGEKNYEGAINWLSKAARQGMASAQFCLGLVLLRGKKAMRREAIQWIRSAAEQGYSEARHKMGLMLLRGEHIKENFGESLKWLRAAAAQGHAEAQQLLSLEIDAAWLPRR